MNSVHRSLPESRRVERLLRFYLSFGRGGVLLHVQGHGCFDRISVLCSKGNDHLVVFFDQLLALILL